MPNTVKLHRVFKTKPERLYKAFLDPKAMVKWLPPHGFTAEVHELDARVGGRYKMSFTNFGTGSSHSFGGEYLELVPNKKIVHTDQFDNPGLPGVIKVTIEIKPVICGAELHVTQENLPDAIPVEMCYLGWGESLELLKLLVEPEIPGRRMKIYWIHAQAPRRVLALAKHLGTPAEFVEIDAKAGGLRAPDYVALNPNKKAPTLVDGELVLWESGAIMAHLCVKAGSDLWPTKDLAEQIEVLRWLSWDDCHWAPAVGPWYFEFIVKKQFALGPPDPKELEAGLREFTKFAKVLDAHLSGKTFVACNRLTIADFHLASMACYWRESEMPMAQFPNIVAWLDRLDTIPAWKDPWPA